MIQATWEEPKDRALYIAEISHQNNNIYHHRVVILRGNRIRSQSLLLRLLIASLPCSFTEVIGYRVSGDLFAGRSRRAFAILGLQGQLVGCGTVACQSDGMLRAGLSRSEGRGIAGDFSVLAL